MELLVLWLGTTITSLGLEMAYGLRMFKDAADAGYKIDSERLSELGNVLNPNASKVLILSMFIPIFNVMKVFQKTIQYNNVRPMILDQLSAIDALEEMSEIEKMEYLKKPTGLNALIAPIKAEIRLSHANTIKIEGDNEYSVIYYEMGESLDDITILKVSGPASRLPAEFLKKFVQRETKKHIDAETFSDTLKSNTSIDLNDREGNTTDEETISPIPQEVGRSEQLQVLKGLEESERLEEEISDQKEEGPKLIKRR